MNADYQTSYQMGKAGSSQGKTSNSIAQILSASNSDDSIPVKYTPVTGRISRAKKGVQLHTCESCNKTYTRAEHLQRHQLKHQKAEYGCEFENCERVFHRPDLLDRHMHRHDTQGEKAYISGDPERTRASSESPPTTFPPNDLGFDQAPKKVSTFYTKYHGKEEIQNNILTHLAYISQKGTLEKDPGKFRVTFFIDWDVKEFMKEQFGGISEKRLGSVIAITGSALCAEATTVENYLMQYWPESGPVFLEALQAELDSGGSSAATGKIGMGSSFTGTQVDIVEFAQQFAWLGSALRTSPSDQVGCSQCQLSVVDFVGVDASWEMKFQITPIPNQETSCWNKLFSNAVIAYNFPIAVRNFGKGLEIPIDMMAALGGASQAVDFEGGLMLKGFSSMFVPKKFFDECIQWHFVINEDESRLPYWEVDDRCPGRALLNEIDWKSLTTARSFLGWWGTTTCHLGTSDANYHNLDWSDTKEPGRSLHFDGGSLGFQNMLVGELNFSPGLKDGKLHISRTGPYQRILKYARRTPIVLYDTCEKRGWLVPSSAVIAHIAQTRHFRESFSIDNKLVQMKATDSTLDIHEGAEKMLLANFQLKLYQGELGMGDFYFRDLVLNIWTILESLMDSNMKKESARKPVVQSTLRVNLKGWEFMDVVDERSPIRLKETCIQKSNGGWLDLAADINAVVLFASGFEDLIQPALDEMTGLCHKWKRVPKDKDYLTVNVALLNNLHEEAGSRLTRKHLTSTHLQWNRGKVLFEPCPNYRAYQCSCDRLQQIFHESFLTFGEITPPGPLQNQGAVIFGQNEHLLSCDSFPTRPKEANTLYKQKNAPLIQYNHVSNLKDASINEKTGEILATTIVDEIKTQEKENGPSEAETMPAEEPFSTIEQESQEDTSKKQAQPVPAEIQFMNGKHLSKDKETQHEYPRGVSSSPLPVQESEAHPSKLPIASKSYKVVSAENNSPRLRRRSVLPSRTQCISNDHIKRLDVN